MVQLLNGVGGMSACEASSLHGTLHTSGCLQLVEILYTEGVHGVEPRDDLRRIGPVHSFSSPAVGYEVTHFLWVEGEGH